MVTIDGKNYELIKNVRDAFDISDIEGKITEYYDNFDYILGDYAYGKVRLKGFNDKDNNSYNKINAFENIDSYIKNCCAYDCKYFILKSLNK